MVYGLKGGVYYLTFFQTYYLNDVQWLRSSGYVNEIYFIYFLQKKKISKRSEFSPGDGVSIMGRPPPLNPQLQLATATRFFFQNHRNYMMCFIFMVLISCEKMKLFWWAKPEILMPKNRENMLKMAENREMTSLAIKWRHHLQTFWNFVTSFNIIKQMSVKKWGYFHHPILSFYKFPILAKFTWNLWNGDRVTFTRNVIKSAHFAEMLPKLVGSLKKGVLKYECCQTGVCAFIFRFIHVLEKCGSGPPPFNP